MRKKIPLALVISAFVMACNEPSGPSFNRTLTRGSSTTVTDEIRGVNGYAYPTGLVAGEVRVCKTVPAGDPTTDFSFTVTTVGVVNSALVESSSQHQILGVVGGTTQCTDVFTSTANGASLDSVKITENALASNWALTGIDILRIDDGPGYTPPNHGAISGDNVTTDIGTRTATVYVNFDMARIVTFTNDYTPPTTQGCTYTKGWYRNNGSSTVIAVDGRSISDAQAIFAATPGKPGNVTFGGDATLLNLYQQFLAALNNLGGDANAHNGPQAVDDAIDAVDLGTSDGPGLAITTTLTQSEMAGYIATLSAFNEGTLSGWPHCAD